MSQVVPPGRENNSRMLWLQLLAGPVIWAVHFVSGYLLVETFCQTGSNFDILGIDGLYFILVTITLLAMIVSGFFGLKSYRNLINLNRNKSFKDRSKALVGWSDEAVEFMNLSGLLLSMLFTATILMVGLPVLFLRTCG